jgi:hypothetical protein
MSPLGEIMCYPWFHGFTVADKKNSLIHGDAHLLIVSVSPSRRGNWYVLFGKQVAGKRFGT